MITTAQRSSIWYRILIIRKEDSNFSRKTTSEGGGVSLKLEMWFSSQTLYRKYLKLLLTIFLRTRKMTYSLKSITYRYTPYIPPLPVIETFPFVITIKEISIKIQILILNKLRDKWLFKYIDYAIWFYNIRQYHKPLILGVDLSD